MRTAFLIALMLPPALALADPADGACPSADPAAAPGDALFEALRSSRSEMEGYEAASAIWRIFRTAPDARAQDLLDSGIRRIHQGDPEGAEPILDQLVDYCPDYAEGWNQRALARFLTGNYDAALEDLDRTLELEPRHFGALAGKALTLLRQGRAELGHEVLREGLEIHPWMSERHLLPPSEKI